jgi:flagellar protein FliO/FliZ
MKHLINKFYCLCFFILLTPVKVFAGEVNDSPTSVINTGQMSGGYMLQLVLGLVIVLACIVVLAWLAKRMNRLQSSTGDMLKIIGGINVGSREKIVLLQVGSEQLLIGVSQGNINKLHLLEAPLETLVDNADTAAAGGAGARAKTFSHSLSEKISEAIGKKNSLSEKLANQRTNKK